MSSSDRHLPKETVDERCMCKLCTDRTSETYRLAARCTNCGWSGEGKFRKGDRAPYRGTCPSCGCSDVMYSPRERPMLEKSAS